MSEISTVSICGQKGNPRSAMTSVLVWRMRLSRELMCGFKMPVFNMRSRLLGSGVRGFARLVVRVPV
jgi:hypothetical protein